ncbi:Pimeloyl-ACP methyl ester carboxylesterase [Shimia marina]|uniref:Lipase 1 n=1 Tax=Shimia marina TaxID=321267 RepID=A0A0P1EUP1_9RHOB|nr:Lipase 1 precursor [Shimia marina]SFE00465.1 Pimeloyl-ACP methyl ester carboxylesterase [Shimia marina]
MIRALWLSAVRGRGNRGALVRRADVIKSLKYVALGFAALVGAGFAASFLWPQKTAEVMLKGFVASAGLSRHVVETPLGPVHYLQGGEGETVVFLHGIFALKEHWVDMSRQISGSHRVILLDLPGFGENPRLSPEAYDLNQQTKNVQMVLDAIGVERFHVAANSMGAHMAMVMAQQAPERVQSVALIGSPINVAAPELSDMQKAIEAGQAPLVVTSQEGYEARMAWLFPDKPPYLPKPIMDKWLAEEVAHAEINREIWQAVGRSEVPNLEEMAPDVSQPVLILWCQQDRIFHPSGAAVLAQALPDSTVIMPEGCGHLPMLDRKRASGKEYAEFLKAL